MKAKKKKVETLKPEDLGLDFVSRKIRDALARYMLTWQSPRLETISVTAPPERKGGGKVRRIVSGSRFGADTRCRSRTWTSLSLSSRKPVCYKQCSLAYMLDACHIIDAAPRRTLSR